jgi:hypothetical protein
MAITALNHDYDQKMAIAAAFLVAVKKVSKTLLLIIDFLKNCFKLTGKSMLSWSR